MKITWDDVRWGVFGPANSFCDYRVSLDGVPLNSHRRLSVNGATNAVDDWGTFTYFAPSVGAGEHQLTIMILPSGATCSAGSGTVGVSSIIIEGF